MTLAQFSRSQQDVLREIAFCTLYPQHFQNYFMDGYQIWIYSNHEQGHINFFHDIDAGWGDICFCKHYFYFFLIACHVDIVLQTDEHAGFQHQTTA